MTSFHSRCSNVPIQPILRFTIVIAVPTTNPIFFKIQGSKRLKLVPCDDYHLIHIKNDTEELINDVASFNNLPRNSTLKFKKRPPNFNTEPTEGPKIWEGQAVLETPLMEQLEGIAGASGGAAKYQMSNDQEVGKLRRKLEKLHQNMEIMLTFSGNDLRLLADEQGNLLKGIDNKTVRR